MIPVVILTRHDVEGNLVVGKRPSIVFNYAKILLVGYVLEVNLAICCIVLNLKHLLRFSLIESNLGNTGLGSLYN